MLKKKKISLFAVVLRNRKKKKKEKQREKKRKIEREREIITKVQRLGTLLKINYLRRAIPSSELRE